MWYTVNREIFCWKHFDVWYLLFISCWKLQPTDLLAVVDLFGARREKICLGLATTREGFTSLLSYRVARMLKCCCSYLVCSTFQKITKILIRQSCSDVQASLRLCCLHATHWAFLATSPILSIYVLRCIKSWLAGFCLCCLKKACTSLLMILFKI